MPVLINCTNKGCGKYTEATIDVKTNEVYCGDCDKLINNVSHFTKYQLKELKQTKKAKSQAYTIKCGSCQAQELPKVVDDKFLCAKCNQDLNVSEPFKLILKEALSRIEKEKAIK